MLEKHATLVKMAGIGALVVLLLIPLALVDTILEERLVRRDLAIREITSTWGGPQEIVGPVLVVPVRLAPGDATATAEAHILPEKLFIDGSLAPEDRRRGIYRAVVYRGTMTVSGTFHAPDLAALGVNADQLVWSEAWIALAIPDLRGVEGALELEWGDARLKLEPGARLPGFGSGVHARLAAAPRGPTRFAVTLAVNGSDALRFVPVGADNVVKLRSSWASPSFRGAFLPARRSVGPDGFEAEWRASKYGRDLPQQSLELAPQSSALRDRLQAASFGVELYVPIDAYRNVERSVKYGILFVSLVFVVFFMFETRAAVRIHPLQYALVGLAVALFFLVLLAVSEFVPFPSAYASAAGACTLLVSLYSLSVLKTQRRTLVAAGGLAGAFGFLYVVLQLEDYALLVGSIGLSAALAAVMYATRRIDWYATATSSSHPPPAPCSPSPPSGAATP